MGAIRLKTKLVKEGKFAFLYLPSSRLHTRERLRVKGRINGHWFATSAMPWREKQHVIPVDEALRQEIGLVGGEIVQVEVEPDLLPPVEAPLPSELAAALKGHPAAEAALKSLPSASRKYYVDWIESAKRPTLRAQRVETSIKMMMDGRDPFKPRKKTRPKKPVLRAKNSRMRATRSARRSPAARTLKRGARRSSKSR